MTSRPTRALTASTLVNTVGDGLYIAASALFFTRGLGLPVSEVGIGLTCAGVLGLGAGVLVGRMADRRGPKRVLIGIQLVQAAAVGSYVLVGHSFPAFVVVATCVIASMQGADASQGALVGRLGGVDPVRLRAYLHSVSNVGISAGTVIAGMAIADGTHLAYQMVMIGDAGTFLGAALLLLLVPGVAAPAGQETQARVDRSWGAVRDGRYLALAATNAVMSLQYFVLAFAMPLWVIGHTRAPRWLVSPMLLTNTVLIACLQVRFSRGTKTPVGGARSVRWAGGVLAGAMILYGVASGHKEAFAIVALMTAAVAHTLGELLQSAGAFGISYGMAADGALGEYLGVWGIGVGLCRALAPGILTATCLERGDAGWWGLGGLFVLSGLVTKLLVDRGAAGIEGPADGLDRGPQVLLVDSPSRYRDPQDQSVPPH